MAPGRMQAVILVEVSDPDPDDAARAPGAPSDSLSWRLVPAWRWLSQRGRPWWPLVAALVVLVAAAGAVSAAREQARAARLTAAPGVLTPLTASLHALWREQQQGFSQVDGVGSNLLLFGPDPRGVLAVVSVDKLSGRRRWSAPLPEMTPSGDVWCVALGGSDRRDQARLACRVVTASAVDIRTGNYRPQGPVGLLVLDAGTGARLADRELDSVNVGLAPFGHDLVVTQVLPDGRAQVSRQDPVTGLPRWTFRSAQPIGSAAWDLPSLAPSVQHGVIIANGPVSWAFTGDGTVLGEWHLTGGDQASAGGWSLDVAVLPDGRFAVGESGGASSRGQEYGTVSSSDARDGFTIPGPVLQPGVDDGSAADLLLTTARNGAGVVALDAGTGNRRWESPTTLKGGTILLDGRLIGIARSPTAVTGIELTALDTRTGRLLWTVRLPAAGQPEQVLTDGRLLVVPMYAPEAGAVLVAFDPADGRSRWRVQVPARLHHLAVVDRRLYALTEGELIALS